MELNPTVFRKCAVVDSLMRGKPELYQIDVDQAVSRIPIDSSLRNLLQTEKVSEFNFEDVRRQAIRFSKCVIASLAKKEIIAIDQFFEKKKFRPELIDEEGIFHQNLRKHPSIQWALTTLA